MRLRVSLLPPLAAIVAVLACESDRTVTPEPEPAPVWSELTDLPPFTTLYGLWAPRTDLVIGVGHAGSIWQWNGQQWAERMNTDPNDLFAIDGSATGVVVAVGDGGTALEEVSGSFRPRDTHTQEDLRGVWHSDSGLFVAVGSYGTILRGDGRTWSLDPSPTRSPLFGVWGSGDSDVFAVGAGGIILHHDGIEWTGMPSGTPEILSAVSGTSASDVYAAGASGTLLHFDGSNWKPMTSGTTALLQSVCADCGPAAVGANGTVLRMVDGAWRRRKLPGAPWLYAIARADDRLWAAGAHALFARDGTAWFAQARGAVSVLRDVTSSPSTGVVAVGNNGTVLLGGPGQWRFEDAGALQRLNAVWVSPAGEIFAAGTNRIFRRTDTGWVTENSEIIEYFAIGGTGARVFAVGTAGAMRERQGTAWNPVNLVSEDLHAIYMDDVEGYIAGNNGNILYFDGRGWSISHTLSAVVLRDIVAVETDMWRAIAVGDDGVCLGRLHTDIGSGWTALASPVSTALHALATGPGGDLYAAGAGGVVLRLVNDQWTTVVSPTSRGFLAATSRGGALFTCGASDPAGGMLFRFGPPEP